MLIGLNGRKQAGKDTVFQRASHLLAGVMEVERVSFADLLYESAAAALGTTRAVLEAAKTDPRITVALLAANGRPLKEYTIREYLQFYGTEAHRNIFGDNFWVDQVTERLRSHPGRLLMVTDVRFENEARAVLDAGGYVVEVQGYEEGTLDRHPSEAPLPDTLIDFVLDNSERGDNFRALDTGLTWLLRRLLSEEDA